MQETWKFDLEKQQINLPDEELVLEILRKKRKDLGIFLSYYFRKAAAVVEEPEVLNGIQPTAPGQGRLELGFRLVYFNACLNIHEQEKDKIRISFNIDRQSGTVKLIGPDWPEREMDEI